MKSIHKNNKGFTLLEIIIVIIIIGVLASLALPRFFKTVEYSRGTEALAALSTLRQAMNRCYLAENSYTGTVPCTIANLDVEDPGDVIINPRTHFSYNANPTSATTFTITAVRNAFENSGPGGDQIQIDELGAKSGTTAFSGIR